MWYHMIGCFLDQKHTFCLIMGSQITTIGHYINDYWVLYLRLGARLFDPARLLVPLP